MKVYIDYVFFINFLYDFIILLSLNFILKKGIKLKYILLGALFGSFSIVILFLQMNSFLFLCLKITLGILMLIITFGFKGLKDLINNVFYLVVISSILGGFIYFINISFGYSHDGFVFYNNKTINDFVLLIISILLMAFYIRKSVYYKKNYSLHYLIDIFIDEKKYTYKAYLDTGNKLYDPYFHKPIMLIYKPSFMFENVFYVPYNSLNHKGLIECIKLKKIYIHGIGYKYNIVLGKSFDKFLIDDIDIILHKDLLEG